MTVLVVTGTGTGVGKTVVTAAIAALAVASGRRVAVVKVTQTGVGVGQPGDLDQVRRLVGFPITCRELARYPEPLAPATAARRAGLAPVPPATAVAATQQLAPVHDLVLLEGAGGLLVPLDGAGATLADVAAALAAQGITRPLSFPPRLQRWLVPGVLMPLLVNPLALVRNFHQSSQTRELVVTSIQPTATVGLATFSIPVTYHKAGPIHDDTQKAPVQVLSMEPTEKQ